MFSFKNAKSVTLQHVCAEAHGAPVDPEDSFVHVFIFARALVVSKPSFPR